MSGLLALLDDVVALAKLAAASVDDVASQAVKAGTKAAGVVIDDAAVTPRYVAGLSASRELSVIGRIAYGSIKNKLLILLPAALLLSVFLPQAITPLLMFGGLFLCFEGYEKLHHTMFGAKHGATPLPLMAPESADTRALEDQRVASAVRTDFILSAEIMAIALNTISAPDLVTRAVVLAIVAIFITVAVYGAVTLIVKADDVGVHLANRNGFISGPVGRALVHGVPPFMVFLSFVGMIAMLWVGGGIIVHGLAELGYKDLEHHIHEFAIAVKSALPFASGMMEWVVTAAAAAIVGVVVGAVVALAVAIVTFPFKSRAPSTH